jgi:predicted Zn finger-like uncharacterized protein
MIIQCSDCQTRFKLDPDRVPHRAIRVRCSKCRYVFNVDGTVLDAGPIDVGSAPAPVVETQSFQAVSTSAPQPVVPELDNSIDEPAPPDSAPTPTSSGGFGLELERSEVASLAKEDASVPVAEVEVPSATATLEPETGADAAAQPTPAAEVDPKLKKARRLARALVSDILVYNREIRDRALTDGTLVQALGQEIKKSWELYKEKVDPDYASESNLFRDALNDILADGQKIF